MYVDNYDLFDIIKDVIKENDYVLKKASFEETKKWWVPITNVD